MFVDNDTKLNVLLCLLPSLGADCVSSVIEQLGKVYRIPDKYKNNKRKILARDYWKHYNRYGLIIPAFFEDEYENYLKPMCKKFRDVKMTKYGDEDIDFCSFGVIVIYNEWKYKYKSILKVPDVDKIKAKTYLKRIGVKNILCCPLPRKKE